MKVFVPFSEALIDELGLSIGELVPYRLEYDCVRAYGPDGTGGSGILDLALARSGGSAGSAALGGPVESGHEADDRGSANR